MSNSDNFRFIKDKSYPPVIYSSSYTLLELIPIVFVFMQYQKINENATYRFWTEGKRI